MPFTDTRNNCSTPKAAGDIGLVAIHPSKASWLLHNSFEVRDHMPNIQLSAPAFPSHSRPFRNAHAAFEALKFWRQAAEFESLSAKQALQLAAELSGLEDWTYGGYGSSWSAMLAVLRAKFRPCSPLASALIETEQSFLLQLGPPEKAGVECCAGESGTSGMNCMGLQLMLVRDELQAATGALSSWTSWLGKHVNLTSGSGTASVATWKEMVQLAHASWTTASAISQPKPPGQNDQQPEQQEKPEAATAKAKAAAEAKAAAKARNAKAAKAKAAKAAKANTAWEQLGALRAQHGSNSGNQDADLWSPW